MEEEKGIGSIIFYIVAAIIAIISSIKGKKKQQETQTGEYPTPANRPGGFPDDMFDDEVEEPAYQEAYNDSPWGSTPKVPEPAVRKVYPAFEAEGTLVEPMAEKFSGEGVSALDHVETARRFEELVRQTETKVYDLKEADLYDYEAKESDIEEEEIEFDARQAIVWATIIERKEY
jgi:hypothetical protein